MSWNPDHLPSAHGRTFAVTGSTAGIGYFAAEQLARAGAHVVIAGRSPQRIATAIEAIQAEVPGASLGSVLIDLTSLDSVTAAAQELAALPRLDGILLNGAAMSGNRTATTADGLPLMLGTHAVANHLLIASTLDALARTSAAHGRPARIGHVSTGFVSRLGSLPADLQELPRLGITAYTRAKGITETFAFELDRRLRAANVPVESLVSRPGVGVDAKTPLRPGVHDQSTPHRRSPYTPWAQGKDSAAWSAVRTLLDPEARGGEQYAPAERLRGVPVKVQPWALTSSPGPEAQRIWDSLARLSGRRIDLAASPLM